jgi:hypothetical protein
VKVICALPTSVGSVQEYGQRALWPQHVVYVGMPGPTARGWGIPDAEGSFGKPWAFKEDPRGWAAAYCEYMAKRLITEPEFAQAVKALHSMTLLCYCTRKAANRGHEVPCHARILREYVEMLHHSRR